MSIPKIKNFLKKFIFPWLISFLFFEGAYLKNFTTHKICSEKFCSWIFSSMHFSKQTKYSVSIWRNRRNIEFIVMSHNFAFCVFYRCPFKLFSTSNSKVLHQFFKRFKLHFFPCDIAKGPISYPIYKYRYSETCR